MVVEVQPSSQESGLSLLQVSGCLSCHHEIGLEPAAAASGRGGSSRPPSWPAAAVRSGRVPAPTVLRAPGAGGPSARVHSAYERRLADAPIGGQPVVIRLAVRRFFCRNQDCPAITFAEQVDGLTSRRARRTPPLGSDAHRDRAGPGRAGPGRGSPRSWT